MKILYFPILFLSLFFLSCEKKSSTDIEGRWYSKMEINDEEFYYLINVSRDGDKLKGRLDLPAENNFLLDLDSIKIVEGKQLYFSQNGLQIQFTGTINHQDETIDGQITRDGIISKLTFTRQPQAKRSQVIKKPIPYESEEVYFYNKDSTRFAGTITFPKQADSLTAVILITGSGPQNRDEEILGHKPFLVLADYLSRRGIAVLRYDDRGYGKSAGQFGGATSLDFSYDALAAVEYLKNHSGLPIDKIGLIGHSEGGNIAPVVATMDPAVDFLVLLAAPGISNYESYLSSLDLILREDPDTYDRDYPFFKSVYKDMATIEDKAILKDSMQSKFEYIAGIMEEEEFVNYGGADNYISSQVDRHTSDRYHYYLQFDVTEYLIKLKIPILALNGDKDNVVESSLNLKGIENTLKTSGHTQYEIVELKNVNHFFQESDSEKIERVYFNENTFSELALDKIATWINGL